MTGLVLAAAAALTLVSAGAKAEVKPPATLKMKVAIGLGYHLCPERKTLPSLQDAYLCAGMVGVPKTIELDLVNKPAAKPTWLFYEAPYNTSLTFNNVTVTMEALVMYSKVEGQTTGYVDGRLISTQNGKQSEPVYFRASAPGGLENLTYSSSYGAKSMIQLSKGQGEFAPYVTITKADAQ